MNCDTVKQCIACIIHSCE